MWCVNKTTGKTCNDLVGGPVAVRFCRKGYLIRYIPASRIELWGCLSRPCANILFSHFLLPEQAGKKEKRGIRC